MEDRVMVHPTADVASGVRIGHGTRVWHDCQIREGAEIGRDCILGKGVYVDAGVRIGHRVKVQNGVSLFRGVTLEDGVFCGPHVAFTNDLNPRAVLPDGSVKGVDAWQVSPTLVRAGASIGANATIVCGITIGCWAAVGAGAVVTRDVPDHGLVYGNPARLHGYVCACGRPLAGAGEPPTSMRCPVCVSEATPHATDASGASRHTS